ncbi:hypothetical protein KY342_06350 [Candidatus Woesearchaeota archaeon]|nr:hypothetical protein [Candidatus Woesearchaeota archaeon]
MGIRIEVMTKGSIDNPEARLIAKRPVKVFNINDDSLTSDEVSQIERLLSDPVGDYVASNSSILTKIPKEEGIIEPPDMFMEVSPKPGVTDPEGQAVRDAIKKMLGRDIGEVSYGIQFWWRGKLEEEKHLLMKKQLGNPLINEFIFANVNKDNAVKGIGFHFPSVPDKNVEPFQYVDINLTDEGLVKLSDDRLLALNLNEMKTIRDGLFKDPVFLEKRKEIGLGPMPTDAELEGLAQRWSEHCCHKKFTAEWIYTSDDPNDRSGLSPIVNNMLKSIIVSSTAKIAKNVDWMVSVFEDNAGVIKLNDEENISHKVETHNHPSGLDGYGGANTGLGGVIRDPLSTGRGMEPCAGAYAYRTPHPKSLQDLPPDIQYPKRTLETVISGVEDYGNKIGLPTASQLILIDDGYLKPAVFCDCKATAPREVAGKTTHVKDIKPGYIAVSIGGKVGKDGIHGATASSIALSSDAEQRQDVNQSVQIGNPITEKGVIEVMMTARDMGIVEATQDCGAGGWNSALGELTELLQELEEKRYTIQEVFKEKGITEKADYEARIAVVPVEVGLNKIASPVSDLLKEEIKSGEIFRIKTNGKGGSVVDLTHAPEKYKGMAGWEKKVSEAQEREVMAIKPINLPLLKKICDSNNVELTVIAEFNDTGYYEVKDQNTTISYIPVDFMSQGLPQMIIKAHHKPCQNQEPNIIADEDLTKTVLELLGTANIQIYDWISTRYDHEVQGRSFIKPLVGIGKGKSDAVAWQGKLGYDEVVIETMGSNPWHGDIDAYEMGVNNVVDAIGRVIAAGGHLPDRDTYKITFNGNTICPKPEKDPEIAAKVLRMVKGVSDAEVALVAPTISGKDSTSMERSYISTKTGKEVTLKAKPEILMSAMAVIPNESTLTTCDFKLPGDLIYVVGDTKDELGASEYYLMNGETGRNVPISNLDEIKTRYKSLTNAVENELVHSAQYIGKGGLIVSLLNSSAAGDLGVQVDKLENIDEGLGRADKILFSETTGRFVVSVHPSKKLEFEKAMEGCYMKEVGCVRTDKEVCLRYNGKNIVSTDLEKVREANKGEIIFK